ncbi:Amino-acid acetyltransferase, mitochondrial [Tulasnella sp. 424]|nr:Amino-acid acetyltransferase, mitochondrial [Tulasnella sp. 424]KAG8969842.1 Amino-acid acetyltransferase, mitochondrial [Tulasnella sp. 425]
MIASTSAAVGLKSVRKAAAAVVGRSAISTTRRCYYQNTSPNDEVPGGMNDFILSILEASPSSRDAKNYLGTFGKQPSNGKMPSTTPSLIPRPAISPNDKNPLNLPADILAAQKPLLQGTAEPQPEAQKTALALLDPIPRRTALVKFQGPFTDNALDSICRGMVYLEKLGLVSVIVVENDDWHPGQDGERAQARDDVMRIAAALERGGAKARPILEPLVRLGPPPAEPESEHDALVHEQRKALLVEDGDPRRPRPEEVEIPPTEVQAHARLEDLSAIRSALKSGEIPVVAPLASDSFHRMVRVDSSDVVAALVRSMVEAGKALQLKKDSIAATNAHEDPTETPERPLPEDEVDLTPLRLMIISKEGGVPSYARQGLPHLLINLSSEHSHIVRTFSPTWSASHPTSLANLSLSRTCLEYMPPSSSAIVVSHKSPRSLIGNLVTNKPAQSSSLPAYLLTTGAKAVTPHTPTLIRKGLPMRVIRRDRMHEIDKDKMTKLLEASFRRTLKAEEFYERMDTVLDYVIVAGDYAGACIVTEEPMPNSTTGRCSLSYLDKFAVHPSHQGDGTVDFLWVALHDESFGCGLAHALNPNQGGKLGLGTGCDLVWRSRTNNPANRWYYERSSGHLRLGEKGEWTMFWCDAEERLKDKELELIEQGREGAKYVPGRKGRQVEGLSFCVEGEEGRLDEWKQVVAAIPSCWA